MTDEEKQGRAPVDATAGLAIVLLCGDLRRKGIGLDLQDLARLVETAVERVEVRTAEHLCHAPQELARLAADEPERLVLGLCSRETALVEMRHQARRMGLDPLGVEVVNLGSLCAYISDEGLRLEKAKLLLAGAVARARAYSDSSADTLKPTFVPSAHRVSRRALFTLPPLQYEPVAGIDDTACVAGNGCRVCIQSCPRGALVRTGNAVSVDKWGCDGCGLCVSACPRAATSLPGYDRSQLEAQIGALSSLDSHRLKNWGLLFVCRRRAEALERMGEGAIGSSQSWLPVQVPCVGAVPAGCVLQCVRRGMAVRVVVGGDECSCDQAENTRGMIDYCRELLRLLGGDPEQVRVVDLGEVPAPVGVEGQPVPPRDMGTKEDGVSPMFGPEGVVDALRGLMEQSVSRDELSLEHSSSPLGLVSVDAQRCTGCGACASTCPTGALRFHEGDERVALTFDASSCIGCGHCVAACPEADRDVITVKRVTDTARLAQGPEPLYEDTRRRCAGCGGAVAPRGMIRRVAALLGEEDDRVGRYCSSCRGLR